MLNRIDLTRIDLNLLVLFEAVFEERHVGRAAGRVHVSPSAVSHGLRRLRELFDDPLFLRTPKGVVPTGRAGELARPIGEILASVRHVMGTVESFDPARVRRRFTLGTADASAAVLLPRLLALLAREAPFVDLSVKQLLPMSGLAELESGAVDVAVLAVAELPARFSAKVVYEEEFVIAARAGHAFLKAPSLRRYCELRHVLVSISGDSNGYVDRVLAQRGLARRVALTVPSFMLALAALTETELVAAIPSILVAAHAHRFGVAAAKAPLALRRWQLRAIATKAAMLDAGVAWLFASIERAAQLLRPPPRSRLAGARSTASRRR